MNRLRWIVTAFIGFLLLPLPASGQSTAGKSSADMSSADKSSRPENPGAIGGRQVASKAPNTDCVPTRTFSVSVPASTGFHNVDTARYVRPGMTFERVARALEQVLTRVNYSGLGYYCVEGGGFAIATPYERIDGNGAPCPDSSRWKLDPPSLGSCSADTWMARAASVGRELLAAKPDYGLYRTLVIYVTESNCREDDGRRMTPAVARRLSHSLSGPPHGLTRPFTARARIVVYSYVYERMVFGGPEGPGRVIPVMSQLQRTGIQLSP